MEIWLCALGARSLTQVYQHLISGNSLLFLISQWDLITARSCLYLGLGKGDLVRTKSDGKIQGSSTKWGIAMETIQLLSKLSTMAFLFCHRLFRRKRQHNASFPGAVSGAFLRCPRHNSGQAVVFAAHPWKTSWLRERCRKYCYRKCRGYCSPPRKLCVFSSPGWEPWKLRRGSFMYYGQLGF